LVHLQSCSQAVEAAPDVALHAQREFDDAGDLDGCEPVELERLLRGGARGCTESRGKRAT